jgi:hypothetical protein
VPLRYCYEPASHGRSPSRPHCRGPEGTATPLTVAAARLATSITELAIPGLGACADVVALEEGAIATKTLRRAALSLQTARSLGAGRVIRHAATR